MRHFPANFRDSITEGNPGTDNLPGSLTKPRSVGLMSSTIDGSRIISR